MSIIETKKELKFYKITLQNPNPSDSDFAADKNFSFDWSIQFLSAIIITEKLRIHHKFSTKNAVHFQECSALHISALSYLMAYHQYLNIQVFRDLISQKKFLLRTSNLYLDIIFQLQLDVLERV